ncbi:MAG: hypothetical protein QFB86_01390 [Patescibacteria group bacterium]|nr:hypothetical protein [Patescibacteria group bacterium]
MSEKSSTDRLVRNEQLIRTKNTKIKNGIRKYFRGHKTVVNAPLEFTCECSQLNCNKFVETTIENYEAIHKRRDHFTIFRGHITPAVEKLVSDDDSFDVVQKYQLTA